MYGKKQMVCMKRRGEGGYLTHASIRECKYWVMIECTYRAVLGFDRYEECNYWRQRWFKSISSLIDILLWNKLC